MCFFLDCWLIWYWFKLLLFGQSAVQSELSADILVSKHRIYSHYAPYFSSLILCHVCSMIIIAEVLLLLQSYITI